MRFRPRLDNNHVDIVEALRGAGALVLSLAGAGGGVPDLLVCYRGRFCLMEVKSKRGKLGADQLAFMSHGWPVEVVKSVDDALAVLIRLAPVAATARVPGVRQ